MKRATVIFIIGAVLFLGQRFFMIGVSYSVMGIPRLGDDAFFYVSKGIGVFKNYNHDTQLQKDIRKQISQQTLLDPTQVQQNLRAEYQAYGGPTVLYDLLIGTIYKLVGSVITSFMISEIVVSLIMFLCFSYFFIALAGFEVAGFGLILLSLIFLPGQGIHYLIASTLALSSGIALMAYCLRERRALVVFLLSSITIMIHLMGAVWVCFAACLLLLRLFEFPQKKDINFFHFLALGAALLVPILIKVFLVKSTVYFSLPYKTVSLQSNLIEILNLNLKAFLIQLQQLNLPTKGILFLSALNLVLMVFTKKILYRERALLLVFSLLLFVSFVVDVPFNPAEVALRVFSAMCIVLVLLLAKQIVVFSKNTLFLKATSLILLIFAFWSGISFNRYVKNNFERRNVINSEIFKNEASKLDINKSTLFYLDNEYSFRQAVLAELESYPSYLYPLIHRQPNKFDFFSNSIPTHMMFPVFNTLNTRVDHKSEHFKVHEYGLELSMLAGVEVKGIGRIDKIFLKIKSTEAAGRLDLLVNGMPKSIHIKSNEESWYALETGALSASLEVKGFSGELFISGIQLNEINSSGKVNWPWGEDVSLHIQFNQNSYVDHRNIDFSMAGIFRSQGMEVFSKIQKIEALSDESGIVISRVRSWQ